MLAIRLPEEINARLEKLAARTGRTKTFYAREAILAHLENLEDLYLAERELAEVQAGRSKLTPLPELMKRYGVEN